MQSISRALKETRVTVWTWAIAAAMSVSFLMMASPAFALNVEIQNAATSAATDGIAAGAAVAVIVLGGVVVYRLVKKFTS